jgi:hypothetical protein
MGFFPKASQFFYKNLFVAMLKKLTSGLHRETPFSGDIVLQKMR